jgi:hypothetical protein
MKGTYAVEIDITDFFESTDPFEYSASQAERGKNAGPETWANAMAYRPALLTTDETIDALRAYVKDFGAWEAEEIAAWDATHCNALFIQLVSGDMREGGLEGELDDSDWRRYEKRAEDGNCSGNIFRADDGRIFYSLCR